MRKLENDLGYVRAALEKADDRRSPPSISLLWAAISVVGFSLFDLRPSAGPLFWTIAGPAGGLVSFWLGWRFSRRVGQGSLDEARAHALHWAGLLVAIFLAVPLAVVGVIDGNALGHVILLLIASGWFFAGIHLVRSYLWIGLATAAGYVALLAIDGFTWTGVGLVIGGSLVASVLVDMRRGPSSC